MSFNNVIGRISLANSNSQESNILDEFSDAWKPRGPLDGAAGLNVVSFDMCVEDNRKKHYTDKYKNSSLIVRRNKEFNIIINLNRDFNAEQDMVQLEFMIGSSPNAKKSTYINVSIGKMKQNGRWKCRVVETKANAVTVGITPDASCIIGRFRIFIAVITDLGKQRTPRNPNTDFYVLFNPWDTEDQVYMDNEEDRQEYVMNDVGTIFNGDYKDITSRSWNFGQFEEGILDACLLIMDNGKVPLMYRGNVIEVVRQGSALLNAQDDKGVLVGNWSGDYSDGTAPTAWTGSPEIMLKYVNEGYEPVRFAQCWVFSGVMNTFSRCLGIPARVITTYHSAVDNTGNLKTDIVLNKDGNWDQSRTKDSIWNFHIWNEVYMKRPDLLEKFSGWQAIDCTPQETSDGLYRCGPASVNAIKEGEVSYPFDAKFVFAEINSDVIYYKADMYGNLKIIRVDTVYVGKLILTQKKDSSDYEDITTNYKYPEGSLKEREIMQFAEQHGAPSRDYLTPPESGVDIELQADAIKIGENLQLTLNIKNQTKQTCTLSAVITGCVVYYTGISSKTFMSEEKSATVEASTTESRTIDVTASEYMPYLVDKSNLLFVVYGQVEESDTSLSTMRVVSLLPPELTMKMTGSPQIGKELVVSVEFLNPYNFTMKDVQLRVDGPGLIPTKLKKYSQILPGASVMYRLLLIPQSLGKKVLMACLDCPQLRQVTNKLEFEVVQDPNTE
ncbi:coagulation factor XIII A chain-like [Carassius gibelio]|uniref:coagulation factor XIII A chain-like n=1 Tax=Carassius gibelio TaxID=101364 RepID=UPI0022798E3C|nr:coagulation factor XIII A chain-like [Carassius gibelio]